MTSYLLLSLQSLCALLFTTIREVTSQPFQTYPFKRDEFVFPNYNSKKVHCVVRKKIYTFSNKTKTENKTESCKRQAAKAVDFFSCIDILKQWRNVIWLSSLAIEKRMVYFPHGILCCSFENSSSSLFLFLAALHVVKIHCTSKTGISHPGVNTCSSMLT